MTSDADAVHVCYAVDVQPRPHVPSVRSTCSRCDRPIWADPVICAEIGLHRHLCVGCTLETIAPDVTLVTPTPADFERVRLHRRGQN